jgi:hypothetical protein
LLANRLALFWALAVDFSNRASIRRTASSAKGEITAGFLP